MIDVHTDARIRRLFAAEGWKPGDIAREVGVHHSTVRRVLRDAGLIEKRVLKVGTRRSILDPFLPFIHETLERHPRLNAARLYQMVVERGYRGSPGHFRSLIRELRPTPPTEAFLRLRTTPGEQAQVDWGSFGTVEVGRAKRKLSAFVMVLSHSRKPFLRFFYDQRMPSFLLGHVEAFEAFGGVPRVLLYDNLKSAVLERHGDLIRFHPELLAISAHYCFEPRPVGVRRGNEKGRVERAIRYIRGSFFAARDFVDLDDLNAQADTWCATIASERPCPGDRSLSVDSVFAIEQPFLRTLPEDRYVCEDVIDVKVGKTPYVRFDGNDYSVPHLLVRKRLSVRATRTEVRVVDREAVVATHQRSYDKGACIEVTEHVAALVAMKLQARQHRATDRLAEHVPNSVELLGRVALRGDNLGSAVSALTRMLRTHGAAALEAAIAQALMAERPHPNSVRTFLERTEDSPRIPVELPNDPRVRELTVKPHPLTAYDSLVDTSGAQTKEPKPCS